RRLLEAPAPRRRLRTGRRGLLLGGVIALAAGGTIATAAIFTGDPAPEEIQSYSRDASIPPDVARSELLDQRKLPALADTAQRELGDAFAGVWVDADGSRRIVLALVDGAPEDRARELIAEAGLEGRVDIVHRARGAEALDAIRRTLDAELVSINKAAPSAINVEVDPRTNQVLVRRPARTATPEQRRFLEALPERYPASELRIAESAGEFKLERRCPPRSAESRSAC
ncbi:hypothetical protein OJ997_33055, partial [Solirubrobacter phytolaccae]